MSVELKVKSKHLSEEARIIRFEERKQLKQFEWAKRKHYATGSNDAYPYYNDKAWRNYYNLNGHRRWDVRNENRATFLARAYIAGKAYNTVEFKRKDDGMFQTLIVPRIVNMVAKYGDNKMPLKVYDHVARQMSDNPDLVMLKKKIVEWATLPVDN
jgi:hypothetical protein